MVELLEARAVSVDYGRVRAVHELDLVVPAGPAGVALIGESGSGKTTIARALMRLQPVASGTVSLEGVDITTLSGGRLLAYRRAVQIVFQDGDAALDPRIRVGGAVVEALRAHGIGTRSERPAAAAALLAEVGLEDDLMHRYPHQLSGGQRQRVIIARALAVAPRLLVLDEPTSALDVTVQARILDLIERLREERALSYLLISHNLAVVDRLCEQAVVLYRGRVVEQGPTRAVLDAPAHPYTQELRASVPELGVPPRVRPLRATAPEPTPGGCPYAARCPLAFDRCLAERPVLRPLDAGRAVACHRA